MDGRQLIIDILLKKKIITDVSEIRDDMTLEDLDVDSLDLLDIIFEAEGVIQLKIPFEEAKKVQTFQDVVNLVQGLVDNPPQQDPRHVNIEEIPKLSDMLKNLPKD
jgi:acyl carrier protein